MCLKLGLWLWHWENFRYHSNKIKTFPFNSFQHKTEYLPPIHVSVFLSSHYKTSRLRVLNYHHYNRWFYIIAFLLLLLISSVRRWGSCYWVSVLPSQRQCWHCVGCFTCRLWVCALCYWLLYCLSSSGWPHEEKPAIQTCRNLPLNNKTFKKENSIKYLKFNKCWVLAFYRLLVWVITKRKNVWSRGEQEK